MYRPYYNLIVFEGRNEVILATAANVNEVIENWFLKCERSLDDYTITLVNSDVGFAVGINYKTQIPLVSPPIIKSYLTVDEADCINYDVMELMPNSLREKLIDAGLLTDK